MKERRAFLASAAAVVGGGCLGRITADVEFVLSAKTVKRTESALVPEVNVVDAEATTASPATVRITVHNRSLRAVSTVARGPGDGDGYWGLIGSAVSKDSRMRITEPGLAERVGDPPCWWARFPLIGGYISGPWIPALRSQSLTLAIGAADHGGCLEPGSYHFEQQYEQAEDVADVDWAFELLLSEPGV